MKVLLICFKVFKYQLHSRHTKWLEFQRLQLIILVPLLPTQMWLDISIYLVPGTALLTWDARCSGWSLGKLSGNCTTCCWRVSLQLPPPAPHHRAPWSSPSVPPPILSFTAHPTLSTHYLHIYTSEVALWCSVWPKWWENVMGMWQQSFNNSVHGTLMAFLIPQMGLITILLTSALGNSFNLGLLWAFSSIMVFSPWWGKTEKWFRPTFLKEKN